MKAQPVKLAAHGSEKRALVCVCSRCNAKTQRIRERQRRYRAMLREASNARKEQRRAWAARRWPQELQEGR